MVHILVGMEEELRLIPETIQDVFWMSTPGITHMLYVSPAYERIWGRSLDSLYQRPQSFIEAIHPQDRAQVQQGIPGHARGEWEFEYRILRPDGSVRWIHDRAFPVYDDRGNLVRMVGVARDITDRVQAEERVKAALIEKETLLHELHHRVKNNLQIISTLLDLQAAAADDERVRIVFQRSQDRIQAMAAIHEHLYRATDVDHIDVAAYISGLVADLRLAYDTAATDVQTDVAHLSLGVELAVPCGLIVNELVTNAFKHAFPPGYYHGEGQIGVSLHPSASGNGVIELMVSDNGIGIPADVDLQQPASLGLTIVSLLTGELEGRLELDRRQGTSFSVTFNAGAPAGRKDR
jgi:PAS domain S-box-containing protein